MMRPHVTEIGTGVAKKEGEHTYTAVQLFARPVTRRYQIEIRNMAPKAIAYNLDSSSYNLAPRAAVTFSPCTPMTLIFANPVKALPFTTAPNTQYVVSNQGGQLIAASQ